MVNQRKTGGRGAAINPVRLPRPGENDILCGKDRACANHNGSRRFRAVIDSYRSRYMKAITKYDKMMITKEIYEILSQESRFLKYNEKVKAWEEITPLAGRDKIGHALRFANRELAPKKRLPSNRRGQLKRSGSMSSTTSSVSSTADDSASSSDLAADQQPDHAHSEEQNHHQPPLLIKRKSKAELAASIVEISKGEPMIWDSLVGHIQNAVLAGNDNDEDEHHYQPKKRPSITDPVALENMAYAVDTKTSDAALDDLIGMLNDDLVSEEQLQEFLGLAVSDHHHNHHSRTAEDREEATEKKQQPQPPKSFSDAKTQYHQQKRGNHSRQFSLHMDVRPGTKHARIMSADDDMWSVMKEPLWDWASESEETVSSV